ncbi:unnamed protein product, partial [marine sediment metagenome]
MHRELALWAIFHNSVLFRDFFVPVAWGEKYYHTRYYQYPAALAEDAVELGGRSTGKSIDLEFQEIQDDINDYDQESLITAFRSLHIKARLEKIIFLIIFRLFGILEGVNDISPLGTSAVNGDCPRLIE